MFKSDSIKSIKSLNPPRTITPLSVFGNEFLSSCVSPFDRSNHKRFNQRLTMWVCEMKFAKKLKKKNSMIIVIWTLWRKFLVSTLIGFSKLRLRASPSCARLELGLNVTEIVFLKKINCKLWVYLLDNVSKFDEYENMCDLWDDALEDDLYDPAELE